MELSNQQKRAVEHIGSPALVVAGAGSGKTRTLTAKISYLISHGYRPERILAITFTNKAAEEMKNRLIRLTGLPLKRFPWVRTYHSACFIILKTHCRQLGFEPPVQVYADYQQQKLLRDIIVGEMNFDKKHVGAVKALISKAKNSGNPEQYFDRKHLSRISHIRLIDVFNRYEKALKNANAVDFDNILLLARNLLRDHKDVRDSYRQRFDYLLVDEYQDTNNLQEELTRLLLKDGNLFCVGDDWQAIYSFRGSNINHFLSFPNKYNNAKVFRLEQNYRSADEIVQAANDLIGYNRHRMEKECFSAKQGGVVKIHRFDSDADEAHWTVRKVIAYKNKGISLEQMIVLYRTKFASLFFEKSCRANGIPYRMMGGKGFFERKEIMDLNCYLAAALFTHDNASFERIINIPKRGIGPKTILKIAATRTGEMSLQDAARKALTDKIFTPKIYQGLKLLIELLDEIKVMKPDQALRTVISRVNYKTYLQDYTKGARMDFTTRIENMDQLIHSASQKDSIVDYLEESALVREDKADDDDGFGLNLSTIHAAKGLEFKVVFVVACEEGLFPHWRSSGSEAGLEEERRLMYVSVTRAERWLHISSAAWRKGQTSMRSRFVDEMEEAL
jgi:DNA helicase-2/ATP-dependent DNA helicase PcrA